MVTQTRHWWSVLVLAAMVPSGCRAEATSPQREHFVFLADGMTVESRRAAAGEIYALIGRNALPGEPVHLLAAPIDEPIASLVVPSGSANRRLRHREVQPALRALARRLGQSLPASDGQSELQLQLPEIPARVSRLRRTELAPHVVLCGSPLYHDPRRLNWSMKLGHAPLDGSLDAAGSPWNEGMERFPEGTTVAIYTPGAFGLDATHRSEIVRWVRYAYGQRGAAVLSVTPDALTAFTADRVLFAQPVSPRRNGSGMRLVVRTSDETPTEAKQAPTEAVTAAEDAPKPAEVPTQPMYSEGILAEPPVLESLKGALKNVAFVVDRSGSMAIDDKTHPTPERDTALLADVQTKVRGVECERLALIGFGGKGEEGDQERLHYFPWRLWSACWSQGTAANREAACKSVVSWPAKGGTPTYEALVAASELEGVDTIVLWTDGLPSIPSGDDAQGRVLRLAEELASQGITINCIGVGNLSGRGGGNLDLEGAEFLRRLARATGGEYFAL